MIVGIGVDVCDVARFESALRRTPGLAARLFTAAERGRTVASLAARFAAKEALAKALGGPSQLAWQDVEVANESSGRPVFEVGGSVAAAVEASGARSVHLSLSHDAGIASAFVVLES